MLSQEQKPARDPPSQSVTNVEDPNTLNLLPDPRIFPNKDLDPRLFTQKNEKCEKYFFNFLKIIFLIIKGF